MTPLLERRQDPSAVRPSAAPPSRDRYIDSLRCLALVRVVTYHLLGWAWLPLLFPSMGIMFALGGALVAASLGRARPAAVLRRRVRRLLPPLWALGAVLVPVMLWRGWTYDATTYDGSPLQWSSLVTWVVPIYTPGGSAWASPFTSPLWYLSAYLWFLVLSPGLLWLWRRWPRRTMLLPVVVLAAFGSGTVVSNGSRTDAISLILATYGGCWLLGFAHQDGSLRRLPVRQALGAGCALLAFGAWWAYAHPDPTLGANLDVIPVANAAYGLGYALLLLRFSPSFAWMSRHRVLDALVSAVNSRALTIYLWHNVAVVTAITVEQRYLGGRWYDFGHDWLSRVVQYAIVWAVIGLLVLAVGWVEDVAAARRLRLLPWSKPSGGTAGVTFNRRHRVVRGRHSRRVGAVENELVIDLRDGRPPTAHVARRRRSAVLRPPAAGRRPAD